MTGSASQSIPCGGPVAGASRLAVIAIGRNEGLRLRRCLESVLPHAALVVYVDSGSTDGSVQLATALGAKVVELDMSQPFTAARARNEGFEHVKQTLSPVDHVQFVDGDCEVVPQWFEQARHFLDTHPDVAVACGRRRERFPEQSIYNLLCDIEWSTPIGESRSCGGDVMIRTVALTEVGGYRADLIAGEEPELCVRLRAKGWRVWRLDGEMTLHDAAMSRFGQWWKRSMRAGYAFAEGAYLHGAPPEKHWVRESRSAWLWGAALPATVLITAGFAGPISLWAFLVYPLQVLRLFARGRGTARSRLTRALFLVIGKFAEASGQIKFVANRVARRRARLIEYK